MKKLFLNNKGFSLAEMVVTVGIVGVIGLAAYISLQSSQKVVNTTVVSSEVSNLKNLLITNMTNTETCQINFGGQPVTKDTYAKLDRKFGNSDKIATLPFLEVGKSYGGQGSALTVTKISTKQSTKEANIMELRIDYQIRSNLKRASKINDDFFMTELVIAKSGTTVTNCFTDISRLIKKAVELGCKPSATSTPSAGVTYYPNAVFNPNAGAYGECHHHTIRMADSSNGTVTATVTGTIVERLCPPGEFLSASQTTAGSVSGGVTVKGEVVYTCKKISLATTAVCNNPNEFMRGIDSSGNPICANAVSSASSATTTGQAISTTSTPHAYKSISLSCPPNQVLQSVTAAGPNCVSKSITGTCPAVGQYVQSVNPDGTVNCATFPGSASCTAGTYAKEVNAQAQIVTCANLTWPAQCASGADVMIGLDSSGNAVCTPNN